MTLAFVVVGSGLIGKKHISLIRDNPQTRLVGIVAPDCDPHRAIAATEGVTLYTSLQDCSVSHNIDAVIVASPNEFHFDHGRWCIERQIPVLIEKPLTSNIKDARVLVDLVEARDSKALVGHHRMYSPLLIGAQQIISSGRLGRLVTVLGSAQFYKPSQYFKDGPWRALIGGGPILINLIHEIGILRALVGEISSVQAIASSAVRQFIVEDTVAINLAFTNGAIGTFLLSDTAATPLSWEQTTQENTMFATYDDVDCYIISGTQGYLQFPTLKVRYTPGDTEANWMHPFKEERLTVNRCDPLISQLAHFVEVIEGKSNPRVSVYEGYRNLIAVDAIRRAVTSGKRTRVKE